MKLEVVLNIIYTFNDSKKYKSSTLSGNGNKVVSIAEDIILVVSAPDQGQIRLFLGWGRGWVAILRELRRLYFMRRRVITPNNEI